MTQLKLKPFDPKRYDKFNEAELRCMMLGTLALYNAIMATNPIHAAARANSYLRIALHDKPLRGRHIKKNRKKLAFNLSKSW